MLRGYYKEIWRKIIAVTLQLVLEKTQSLHLVLKRWDYFVPIAGVWKPGLFRETKCIFIFGLFVIWSLPLFNMIVALRGTLCLYTLILTLKAPYCSLYLYACTSICIHMYVLFRSIHHERDTKRTFAHDMITNMWTKTLLFNMACDYEQVRDKHVSWRHSSHCCLANILR